MIKAFIFDLDGTLVNTEKLHYRAFINVGITIPVTLNGSNFQTEHHHAEQDENRCKNLHQTEPFL